MIGFGDIVQDVESLWGGGEASSSGGAAAEAAAAAGGEAAHTPSVSPNASLSSQPFHGLYDAPAPHHAAPTSGPQLAPSQTKVIINS
jgi:hypothetical protein